MLQNSMKIMKSLKQSCCDVKDDFVSGVFFILLHSFSLTHSCNLKADNFISKLQVRVL